MRVRRLLPGLVGLGVVMTVAVGYARGGWAIVTVETLPDHLNAGRTIPIDFTVRQHGVTLMDDLTPRVNVTMNGETSVVNARPTSHKGTYRAEITPKGSGAASVDIRTGFGEANLALMPIPILAAGATPVKQTLHERGRNLFVAKGCASCHTHSSVKFAKSEFLNGPDLTTVRYTPEYLRAFITDPSIKTPTVPLRMPALGLKPDELNAVVSFLTTNEKVAAR